MYVHTFLSPCCTQQQQPFCLRVPWQTPHYPAVCCCLDSAAFTASQKQRVDPQQQQQQQQQVAKKANKTVSGLEIEQQTSQVAGIMSSTTFDSLELSGPTAQGIADMNFSHMTEVQVCDKAG